MGTKLQVVEFSLLCLWTLAFVYCTLRGCPVPISVATAYSAFAAAAAIKVTFNTPSL